MASGLPPNQQLAAPGKWPVVGEKAPRQSGAPWHVAVTGLVSRPRTWSLGELRALPQVERVVDIHCVTRWSRLGVRFSGVPLAALLQDCEPTADARYVSFVAHSERGHSTSLSLDDVLALDVLVALTHESVPLDGVHGGPVRTVVAGRYFYKSLKWLEKVELLAEDRLGYWEAEAGYHNEADPWREQRYMAPALDRRVLRAALETRRFAGLDLRSMSAAGRDLSGLDAQGALLRDADLRRADLRRARFDRANLSNAHLEGADLRGASFVEADVEGADLRGADLRGADFTDASLTAVTLCPEAPGDVFGPARIDDSTRLPEDRLDALTPVQQQYAREALRRGS